VGEIFGGNAGTRLVFLGEVFILGSFVCIGSLWDFDLVES
jgi:hypothetical protein